MSTQVKKKLDPITLLYGIGASIVLVGAMFKFVGWAFANELFIIGLSVEAVIFFISAFEIKREEKDYNWEEVFPQLDQNSDEAADNQANLAVLEEAIRSFSKRVEMLESDLDSFKNHLGQSGQSFEQLGGLVEKQSDLIEELNEKLNTLNERFGKIN